MTMTFELYSTWGCHLCEQAEQMLQQTDRAVSFQVLDIVDHPALFEQYRLLIPVLACVETGETLGWPFDQAQLEAWLQQCVSKDPK